MCIDNINKVEYQGKLLLEKQRNIITLTDVLIRDIKIISTECQVW